MLMGGTLDKASFDWFAWISTFDSFGDRVGTFGWVGQFFTGAHYWVLKAQCSLFGVGGGLLAHGSRTCCRGVWD